MYVSLMYVKKNGKQKFTNFLDEDTRFSEVLVTSRYIKFVEIIFSCGNNRSGCLKWTVVPIEMKYNNLFALSGGNLIGKHDYFEEI